MFLNNILNGYTQYNNVLNAIRSGNVPVSISGIVESAQSGLIASLAFETQRNSLVITYSDMEAKNLYNDISFYNQDVLYFPSKEYVFHNIENANRQNEHSRINVIGKLCGDVGTNIVVTSLEAVMEYTIDKSVYTNSVTDIETGGRIDLSGLEKKLVTMGYKREDMVEGKGQFSVRGGILDIYGPDTENPVRIELFDDEVDSIREFDAMTQRSMDRLDKIVILPCTEAVFSDGRKNEIVAFLKSSIKSLQRKKSDYTELTDTLNTDIEHFEQEHHFPSIDKYAEKIYGRIPTIFDYFDNESMVFIIEPKRISERNKSLEWERGELADEFMQRGILLGGMNFWAGYQDVLGEINKRKPVSLNVLSHSKDDFSYKHLSGFATKTTVSLHGKIEYLYEDLKSWHDSKKTVVILASNRSRGENLAGTLNGRGIVCKYENNIPDKLEKSEVVVMRGNLSKGFEFPDVEFVLISDQEIFVQENRRKKRKVENANRIKSYNDINIGDYVVHQAHGIGQYAGIHKMTVNGVTKDYLKIKYQGTDTLYVPVNQMDVLYKYIGNTDANIKVHKLGGTDWTKTKARVKKSTKDMAKQLIELYAQRENMKGYAFSPDTPWQREFEDTFIYQETDDQIRSIEEVKSDMEKERPMDRLLCGDVGYGKTEVALRAAFKAAADSKQVAYLCPTTILAMQQYDNFCKRMENFPIRVEMLSRFRTPPQQKKILKQLKTGEIDILIGTHRILQKDLEFKDLGLLIVDEEQRFGVAHKERLKEMKKNVDVLTMTATPIPRTLHMAMISIRDMSVLAEPPENRYPVQTYVLEHNRQILADAMKKELARGGQVFYLYNRIRGIYTAAEWIKSMIPDANVAVGHGKMKEEELEDIMYDMVNGKTDILVCTTIIETGLDIPNANTIIIENADKMGLAQLYQLRGRVGRSNRTAYAYLSYKKDSILSDVAQKRLRAIKEFTEFGSGFKIAMRDLEIRGAGNILGAEQHGHMDAVGYDMYCKLLQESINEAKGSRVAENIQISIDVDVDAYIPDGYIKNHNQRIDVYKKISAIENPEDAIEVTDELIDRFGDMPKAAENLIDIAVIKSAAKDAGVYEIAQSGSNVLIKFNTGVVSMKIVAALVQKMPSRILFSASEKPYITYRSGQDGRKNLLDNIKFILQIINELMISEK